MSSKQHDRQREIFLAWANAKVYGRIGRRQVKSIEDFEDGVALCALVESIFNQKIPKYKWKRKPKNKAQKLVNLQIALDFIKSKGAKLVGIGNASIHDGNETLILGLLWTLILTFSLSGSNDDDEEAKRKAAAAASASARKKALLLWAKKLAKQFGLDVKNLTKSWKDGRAFCAIISAFRPDLIDMNEVEKMTPRERLELAFRVGAMLGCPPILKPEDLLDVDVPDEKAIITYLAELKNCLMRNQARELMMWAKKTLGKRAENWDLSDLTSSLWKDGTAILALINEFRPDLVDMNKVENMSKEDRVEMALDLSCSKFGVDSSILTKKDFMSDEPLDAHKFASFLSQLRAGLLKDSTRSKEMMEMKRARSEAISNAVRAALRGAGYASVFYKEALSSLMEAKLHVGTDYWVVLDGTRKGGVYMKREEAVKHAEGGRISGFNNFKVAHKLGQDLQGGAEIWDKHFGDETDDDDVDSSSSDEDSEDEDSPRRKSRRYSYLYQNRDDIALREQFRILSLIHSGEYD